jgi:hypothetical protein
MPPGGRRGNRTPKARPDPPVFETGYRACGSPSTVAPAGFEPATSRLRVGCSAELSYGAKGVAGRSRTCASRVSSGRSTGLSYDHKHERGWSRTSDLLFVRQALIPAELLAPNPGQGIEPRPPGSEPGVLPVRPSRSDLRADTPTPGCPPATKSFTTPFISTWRSTQRRDLSSYVSPGWRRTMFSKPLALLFDPGSHVLGRRRASSWRSFGAGCVRSGAKRHW